MRYGPGWGGGGGGSPPGAGGGGRAGPRGGLSAGPEYKGLRGTGSAPGPPGLPHPRPQILSPPQKIQMKRELPSGLQAGTPGAQRGVTRVRCQAGVTHRALPGGHVLPRGCGGVCVCVSLCIHGCVDTRVRALPAVLIPPSRCFAPRCPRPAPREGRGVPSGRRALSGGCGFTVRRLFLSCVPVRGGPVAAVQASGQCRGEPSQFISRPSGSPPPVGPAGRGRPVGSKLPVTLKRPSPPVPGPGRFWGRGRGSPCRATAQGDKRLRKSGLEVRGSRLQAAGPALAAGPGRPVPLAGRGGPEGSGGAGAVAGSGARRGGLSGALFAPAAGNRRCYHPVY